MRTIKQKNLMLLVTEINDGLAYDGDTLYDVIFVAMVTKTLLKTYPLKYISEINSVTYTFLSFLKSMQYSSFPV